MWNRRVPEQSVNSDDSTTTLVPVMGSSKLSIASLALAIVAVAVFWSVMIAAASGVDAVGKVVLIVAAVAGVTLGTGAMVTGVLARRRVKRGDAVGGGAATAGVVLGMAATVLPAVVLAWMVYTVYSSYEEFQHCVRGSGYPKYFCLKECPVFFDSWCREQIGW